MDTSAERNWTATLVIASDHAGLCKEFKVFENEMYRVLARTDDPRMVRLYVGFLIAASKEWCAKYDLLDALK
jgi:hypothetical protein